MSVGSAVWEGRVVRKGGRESRELRIRKRRLTPGVILITLLMLPGLSLAALASPASADPLRVCTGCPNDPSLCEPNCGNGGGGCSFGTVTVSAAVTVNNPTNASITVSFSGPSIANLSFVWGNTTNYGFSQYDNHTTAAWNIFLNFLDSSTTYYYEAAAANGCWSTGTTTGSWTTASESNYLNANGIVIKGTVKDANNATAPANATLAVEVQCTGYNGGSNDFQSVYFITNSKGTYSLSVASGGEPICSYDYHQGFVVQVLNTPTWYPLPIGVYSGQWTGRWNQTIVVWQPQYVNFYLPLNYVSNHLPTTFDYTNAPGAQGYTDIHAATGASVTESYTYSWSAGAQVYGISGGTSGSQGSSQSWSWQSTIGDNEGTLCYAVQYVVTGTAQFNALTRHWSFSQNESDSQNGNFCANIAGFTMPQPWIHNSTAGGAYYLPGPPTSKYVNGLTNVTLWQGEYIGNESGFTVSGTTQTGLNFGFSLSFTLPGAPSVSATASEDWSQTVSQSTSWGFTLYGESFTSVSCYNVLGEGGSQAQNTATAIAIYYWQGYTETNGGQTTPYCN